MMNTNATNFRKNIFSLLEQTIKYNESINISTKDGNAVLLSEEDYNDLMATLEVYNNPTLYSKLTKGANEALEDCIPEDEVQW